MISGIVNIYKEQGYTSQDVVAIVRGVLSKHYSQRMKAGHTGTLDPNACGALPVCIGKATRIADYLMNGGKAYRAEIIFGLTTDTEDIWGSVLSRTKVEFDDCAFKEVLKSFVGEIEQVPPMYSAVKINGKKLYQLAREGKEIDRPARNVTVKSIKTVGFGGYESLNGDTVYKAVIDVECSKGTYIRTLCKDIGQKLGYGACMGTLVRTRTGNFTADNGVRLDEFKEYTASGRFAELLTPVDKALEIVNVFAAESDTKRLHNGNNITVGSVRVTEGALRLTPQELVLMHDFTGRCVGIFEHDADRGEFTVKTMLLDNQDNDGSADE